MKKGELLESVFLNVNGGQLSADTNVRREDINAMLAPAINFVILKETRVRKRENSQFGWGGNTSMDSEFLATFTLPVKYDDQRGKRYIEPNVKLSPLDSNRGIDTISPIKGEYDFKRLKNEFEDVGMNHLFPNTTRFWFEYIGVSQRIYFKNLPMSVQMLNLRAVAKAGDLNDDDELPLPSGTEIQVLELLTAWFTGQKMMPDDYSADNRDTSTNKPN